MAKSSQANPLACCEEMDEDEWEMIDARKVDYDTEEKQDAMWAFASVPSYGSPDESDQDNELIKVRYAYMPKKKGVSGTYESGPNKGKRFKHDSRDFCTKMVDAGNRVWKKEDIDAASGANPGWGPNGSSTYDIFRYKGGGSCQHFWERRTFLKKDNKRVTVSEARAIIREAGLEPLETPLLTGSLSGKPFTSQLALPTSSANHPLSSEQILCKTWAHWLSWQDRDLGVTVQVSI